VCVLALVWCASVEWCGVRTQIGTIDTGVVFALALVSCQSVPALPGATQVQQCLANTNWPSMTASSRSHEHDTNLP
jgi:hypothetical protein